MHSRVLKLSDMPPTKILIVGSIFPRCPVFSYANLHLHIWCGKWIPSSYRPHGMEWIRPSLLDDRNHSTANETIHQNVPRNKSVATFPIIDDNIIGLLLDDESIPRILPNFFRSPHLPRLKLMVSCFLVGHAHTTDAMWLSQRFTYHHRPNQWCLQ